MERVLDQQLDYFHLDHFNFANAWKILQYSSFLDVDFIEFEILRILGLIVNKADIEKLTRHSIIQIVSMPGCS